MIIFANRIGSAGPIGSDPANRCADLLESFAKRANPDDAVGAVRILVDAAKDGDSQIFQALANWVEAAHGRGKRVKREIVRAWVRLFLTLYDVEGLGRPTGPDMHENLRLNGIHASLKIVQECLAALEGPGQAGRPKSARRG